MSKYNIEKQYHFVLLPELVAKAETSGPNIGQMRENFGSHSFRGYTDKKGVFGKPGAEVEYITSTHNGKNRGKYFTINQSHNCLMVNAGNRDITEKSEFDFISNSPFCEGSPNGRYTVSPEGDRIQIGVIFRLMNSEADAEVALEANIRSSKAVISASEIDEETLSEVAALGLEGLHGAPDKIMRHRVVEWARKRPVDYFEILNSGDRALRSLVRKALADGIFTMKGSLIYWGQTLIGSDEDGAVGTLNKDAQMLDVLKEKLDFKRLDVKKPAGRPVGTTKKNV